MSNKVILIYSCIPNLYPSAYPELIRLGRDHDGGYVVPRLAIERSEVLLSGGYGNDFSFEKAFVAISENRSAIIYDYSISLASLIRDGVHFVARFLFGVSHYPLKYVIDNLLNYLKLMMTQRISLVHKKLTTCSYDENWPTSSLSQAVAYASTQGHQTFFCKLDIEGSEYELIDELVHLAEKFTGLVIEFHDTDQRREAFIQSLKLLDLKFAVVHTHVNNYGGLSKDGQPRVYEISFINRGLLHAEHFVKPAILQELDQPNDPGQPEIRLAYV